MTTSNTATGGDQNALSRMPAVAYKAAREHLGLTGDELAEKLGVNPRTARAWETGRMPIPYRVPGEIGDFLAHTERVESELMERIEGGLREIAVWASTEAMHQAGYHREWSARWWRQIAMRVVVKAGGSIIEA